MEYAGIEKLVNNMLNGIFKNVNMESLSEYDKSRYIYEYLSENIEFDYELLQLKKQKAFDAIPSMNQQVVDIFTKHKGFCSAISQAYKLLLEKLNIKVLAVVGYDEDDIHQFNIVKRNGYWSFDDVTRGIKFPDQRMDNFDYDDLIEKKQRILGILPEEVYDGAYGRHIQREKINLKLNHGTGLFELPVNIKSTKQDKIGISR